MKPPYLILIIPFLIITSLSFAQHKNAKGGSISNESNISLQVSTFPASDNIHDRIDIWYRFSNNFFILTKDIDKGFIARAEISIEIFDISKIYIDRKIFKKEIVNPTAAFEGNSYTSDIIPFYLTRGKYIIVFTATDLQSSRQFKTEKLSTEIIPIAIGTDLKTTLSDIVFLTSFDSTKLTEQSFKPVNLGGNVFFGQPFIAYLELFSKSNNLDSFTLSFKLNKLVDGEIVSTVMESDKEYQILNFLTLEPKENLYFLKPDPYREKSGIILHLPDLKLRPGDYELSVTIEDKLKVDKRFQVIWEDMPKSLLNLDYAIDMLNYIATQNELKDMFSGRLPKRKEAFEKFWEQKDPTPETAYNELMAEYYYRVDFATENFLTIDNQPGAKTDRGKIYILYGKPENTERVLNPGSPAAEIWIYARMKKKFVFEDQKRKGDFKLITIKDL
jgi:GWxTD domain-containing protein